MNIFKLILAIAFLILVMCLPSRSQTNGTNGKVEQPKIVVPPDSIAIFSLNDIKSYLTALKKTSVESYEKLTPEQVVGDLYTWMILEWNRKKKKL